MIGQTPDRYRVESTLGGSDYVERMAAGTRLHDLDFTTRRSTVVAEKLGTVGFGLSASPGRPGEVRSLSAYNSPQRMKGSDFDEIAFFDAIARSEVRALLIGRRALVVLGFPVLTADYDFWIHIDDIERFNAAAAPFDLTASRTPEQARSHGRYALENDEHIDVLVARSVPTTEGQRVVFDDVWSRRRACPLTPAVSAALPSHADLIATKRFASRPKDLEDIRLLELVGPEDEP